MARKKDRGHSLTDDILEELEKRISEVYSQATTEIIDKIIDYYSRYSTKSAIKAQAVLDGLMTQEEYDEWRLNQMIVGRRWEDLKNLLAYELTQSNQIAKEIAYNTMPEVYALNFNYGLFQVEKASGVNTLFNLYNKDAIKVLFDDENKLYHKAGVKLQRKIDLNKDLAWNKRNIQSIMTQGILQGESIPHLATRLQKNASQPFDASDIKDADKKTAEQIAKEVAEKNRKAAIRNARTMTTYVENKGRENAYKATEEIGLKGKKVWRAVHDGRTRHEHRLLDYQKVGIDEKFEVDGYEISEPADPTAAPHLIYNCRCTLDYEFEGFERAKYKNYQEQTIEYKEGDNMVSMSYDEWVKAKAKSQKITHQEEVGELMKYKYINEYRRLKKK